MDFVLQPWQFYVAILSGWINRQQQEVIEYLRTENGMKAFVLDLRNNPGGSLLQAIRIADLFVEDGIIVSIKDRQEPGKTWFAKSEGTGIGTRVVNVGAGGAAFDVADSTDLTIMQLLSATNALTDLPDDMSGFAHIDDQNSDGQIDESEALLRAVANDVYSTINEQGDI